MSTVGIEVLAQALVEKLGLQQQEAQTSVEAFFRLVRNSLADEKSLKIKGLGTFATITAKSSQEPRRKFRMLTFTPEPKWVKEINRPFEPFEAVTLADGMSFDDVTEETVDEKAALSAPTHSVGVDELPVAARWTVGETPETPADVESLLMGTPADTTSKEIPDEMVTNADDASNDEPDAAEAEPEVAASGRKKWWIGAAVAAVVAAVVVALSLGGGKTADETPAVAATEKVDSADVAPTHEDDPETLYAKANEMVAVGAYKIVGVDTVIIVSKGMTLQRIANIFLGSEMQAYLVAINDGNDRPEEGHTYKIPKLELKTGAKSE